MRTMRGRLASPTRLGETSNAARALDGNNLPEVSKMAANHKTLAASSALAVLMLTGAASAETVVTRKPRHHPAHLTSHAKPPLAPHATTAPQTAASGLQPAPMPDPDVTAPVVNPPQTVHTTPKLFDVTHNKLGDGFINGSSASAMEDRDNAKTPGVAIAVPFK